MVLKKDRKHRSEHFVSMLILFGLLGIGGGIFFRQFSFNPAVNVFRQPHFTDLPAIPSSVFGTGQSIIHSTPDLVPISPERTFSSQNLSDKIDGKADLYLSTGFKSLTSQRFRLQGHPELWMEIFVYDMGSPMNAFSVYSVQRRDGAPDLNITPHAYRTDNAIFFVHGPYYLEIIASDGSDAASRKMIEAAGEFIREHRQKSEPFMPSELFPESHLDPESIALLSRDGFGYDQLNRVFVAEYSIDGMTLTAFVSLRKTPEEAEQLLKGYYLFLLSFGGEDLTTELRLKGAKAVQTMGSVEVIFTQGPFFAGVREAADTDQALRLVDTLQKKLSAIHGAP